MAADFDNDGWPDIYVACDMTPSLLFHNLHNGTFEERGAEAGVAFNFDGALQAGMGVSVADYDGDGLLDIAKTNFSGDLTSLYHNDDGKFFTDVSREAGLGARQLLGWGVEFVDVDDDGWPDLVVANGHVYPEVEGKAIGRHVPAADDPVPQPGKRQVLRRDCRGRAGLSGSAPGPRAWRWAMWTGTEVRKSSSSI